MEILVSHRIKNVPEGREFKIASISMGNVWKSSRASSESNTIGLKWCLKFLTAADSHGTPKFGDWRRIKCHLIP